MTGYNTKNMFESLIRRIIRRANCQPRFAIRAALALFLLAGSAALAQNRDVNEIGGITSTANNVEIEIKSTKPFVQSNVPVLKIGDQEFSISRYPEDGDPHRLIFVLTREQFDQLGSNESVEFQYGRGDGHRKRTFGRLNKAKLRQAGK